MRPDLPPGVYPEWPEAIDRFMYDMHAFERCNSPNTVRAYRTTLELHQADAEDAGLVGPQHTTRDHVKQTLERWKSSSRIRGHAVLRSFYRWAMEEGVRPDNPADQVPQTRRRRQPRAFRLTRADVVALMDAAKSPLERRVVYFGVLTGARVTELTLLRVSHLQRAGFVHFSHDIAKGGRERWVPVLPELQPIIAEVVAGSSPATFVLPTRHQRHAGGRGETPQPVSRMYVQRLVKTLARRAGVDPRMSPHTMRHAYAEHLLRHCGNLHVAQHLLGHADVSTTASIYVGVPQLDDLAAGVDGFRYREAA